MAITANKTGYGSGNFNALAFATNDCIAQTIVSPSSGRSVVTGIIVSGWPSAGAIGTNKAPYMILRGQKGSTPPIPNGGASVTGLPSIKEVADAGFTLLAMGLTRLQNDGTVIVTPDCVARNGEIIVIVVATSIDFSAAAPALQNSTLCLTVFGHDEAANVNTTLR